MNHPFRTFAGIVPLAAAWMAMASAGCAHWSFPGDIRIWAISADTAPTRFDAPQLESELFSDHAGSIRLDAGINEVVSFQLLLRTETLPAQIAFVTLGSFDSGTAHFGGDNLHVYREDWITATEFPAWYLRLTSHLAEPREIADVLVPVDARGALPMDIQPGRCEALWVEAHVPVGVPEGEYHARLKITLSTGQSREFRVTLNVWPFALPQTRHLAVLAGVDTTALVRQHLEVQGKPYSPERLTFDDPLYPKAAAIIDATMRLLHDHRCNPMMYDVQPARRIRADGAMELDWGDYDRLVSSVVDGTAFEDRAAAPGWPLPISVHDPAPASLGGWNDPRYEQAVIEYLKQCADHFTQRGWIDRNYLWLPPPGLERGERYRQYERLGKMAHQANPRIRLVCDLSPQSMAPYGRSQDPFRDISSVVGVWATPSSLLDAPSLARQREAGRQVWFIPDSPPFSGSLSVIAPPTHSRSLCWEAFRYKLGGVFLPSINTWPTDGVPRAAGSEQSLIWPGKSYGLESPLPSVRLKQLLRGQQDYEYLWLLTQNRRAAVANIVSADLFSFGGAGAFGDHLLDGRPGGWVGDPASWGLARRLLAREISAVVSQSDTQAASLAEDVAAQGFEAQVEWVRLANAVRRVNAEVEGARLKLVENSNHEPALEVEAIVSAFNATRQPFTGQAAFVDLADGWTTTTNAGWIRDLAPLHAARRSIKARTTLIQPNPDGVFPLRLSIGQDAPPLSGRLCAITSQRLSRPIAIDGRLDDWPLGTHNVAADFVLMGALNVPKQDRRTPDRPSMGTTVFVCNDAEYLYVAFNCEDAPSAARNAARSNAVRYDGLWPTGEDVLEVVIDPTGRAVAPGDLYHVLLKMNGVVITEKGAAPLESVAPSSPWPAGVTAAIDDSPQPGRWTAELRIPLRSLGELAPIWGINFARYTHRLGEYSSWSAARHYLYTPLSLGNIRLAP